MKKIVYSIEVLLNDDGTLSAEFHKDYDYGTQQLAVMQILKAELDDMFNEGISDKKSLSEYFGS